MILRNLYIFSLLISRKFDVAIHDYSGEQREQAQALVERKGTINVKYTPFNFQCRYPTRLRDESLAELGAYGTNV